MSRAVQGVAMLAAPLLSITGFIVFHQRHEIPGGMLLILSVLSTVAIAPASFIRRSNLPQWLGRCILPCTAAGLILFGLGYLLSGALMLALALTLFALLAGPRNAMMGAAALLPALLFLVSFPLQRLAPRAAPVCGIGGIALMIIELLVVAVRRQRRPALIAALAIATIQDVHAETAQTTVPLLNAHAHNDFQHTRPLLDALDQGFTSVEADVFLVDGKLLVAHSKKQATSTRTLESLYLDPLELRVSENAGHVYAGSTVSLQLLVDMKGDGDKTWPGLRQVLQKHEHLLTTFDEAHVIKPGAVTVLLTGNRPSYQLLVAATPILAALDGHLEETATTIPAHLLPLVSAEWSKYFSWRGAETMPTPEQGRLKQMVQQVHACGRQVRFWGAPDVAAAWQSLHDAGVDWINTDNLAGLRAYFYR
jgi:hypothetical protein